MIDTLVVNVINVANDVRQSYPHLTTPLAIAHARNTVSVAELDWDSATAPAYRAVLEASTAELVLAVARKLGAPLDEGDVHEEIGGEATIDGMDPFEWLDAVFCG